MPSHELTGAGLDDADSASPHLQQMARLLLEDAGEGIYGLNPQGFCNFMNRRAREMTGWSMEDMRKQSPHSLIHHSHPDGGPYREADSPILASLLTGHAASREGEVFWRRDGSSFPVAYTSTPVVVKGIIVGAVVVFRDITRQVLERMWEQRKTAIFASIIGRKPSADTLSLIAGGLRAVHPQFCYALLTHDQDKLHLSGEAGLPSALREHIRCVSLTEVTQLCGKVVLQRCQLLEDRHIDAGEHESGPRLLQEWCLPLLRADGDTLGALSIFGQVQPRDLEELGPFAAEAAELARMALEHARLQQELAHRAQHDVLTGLPNRLLLEDCLRESVAAARRRGTVLGVCYIDLDRFKQVNDTLGHGVGDRYLQHITSVLKANCRESDILARQGGDEFILLLPDLRDADEAVALADRLLQQLGIPFSLGEQRFTASASLGISLYPEHGDSAVRLLQHADTALYAAKRAGRNQIRVFDPRLGFEVEKLNRLHMGLLEALQHGHLRLVYQPIYDMDRKLQSMEALLRWDDPLTGSISPRDFIPVAEESGLIIPLGTWVLQEACRQMTAWLAEGWNVPRLFINISGVQLDQDDFPATVAAALEKSGLSASLLGLEITETWIIKDPEAASRRLRLLRDLGVSISIDDFGTGQSSFGSLHQLPLDTLKIDRIFVQRLDGSRKHLSMVRAMVMLAQQFGLRTVAEGVETEAQLQQLRELECDSLQGFLLAKPLEVPDVGALLQQRDEGISRTRTARTPRHAEMALL